VKRAKKADGTVVVKDISQDELPELDARVKSFLERFDDVGPSAEQVRKFQLEQFVTSEEPPEEGADAG
jgi:hypothetical protein